MNFLFLTPRGPEGPDLLETLDAADKVQERWIICRGLGLALPQPRERNTSLLWAGDPKRRCELATLPSPQAKQNHKHAFIHNIQNTQHSHKCL